jgi:hypothetical protein
MERSAAGYQLLVLLFGVHCISRFANGQTSSCISSTSDLEALEAAVTDYSVERQYILCPATTFSIARLDFYGTLITSTGSDMIHLRPNLHLQCGESGESTNNCIISGGSVQLDGTALWKNVTSLENVVITGLTFTNTLQSNVWIDQMGSVLFRDCVFQVSVMLSSDSPEGPIALCKIQLLFLQTLGQYGCFCTHLVGLLQSAVPRNRIGRHV